MRPLLNRIRLLSIVAVVGLTVTTVTTYAWAVAKTVKLIATLLDGGWRVDANLAELLSVIDVYLLAIVQTIIAIGVYELFIGDLDVPEWLEVHSFDDLKKSLIDVLVVFLAVSGVEAVLSSRDALDGLVRAGAVGVLVLVLTLFRFATAKTKTQPSPPR